MMSIVSHLLLLMNLSNFTPDTIKICPIQLLFQFFLKSRALTQTQETEEAFVSDIRRIFDTQKNT